MSPPPLQELQLFAALAGNPDAVGRFLAVFGDAEPLPEVFSDENIMSIMRDVGDKLSVWPVIENFAEVTKNYDRNPVLAEALR